VLCVQRVVFGVWPGPPSSHSFFPGRSPLEFRVLGVVGRLLVLWRVDVLVSFVWVCVLVLGLGLLDPCTCFFLP
jgi:hypothetical protein